MYSKFIIFFSIGYDAKRINKRNRKKKNDKNIKELEIKRFETKRQLEDKLKEILEEDNRMSIKCLEEVIKVPFNKEIICVVKRISGVEERVIYERIEEYFKDEDTVKFIRAFRVIISSELNDEVLKFIANEHNKHLIIVTLK